MRLHCSFRMEKYLALQEERICSEFVLAELLHDKKNKSASKACLLWLKLSSCSKAQAFENKLWQLF